MTEGGFDMNNLLKQAQAMQEQLKQAQEEVASKCYEASAGGDLVTAKVLGTGELTSLTIKPEAIDPNDAEGLADLIVAAVKAAQSQALQSVKASFPNMPDISSLGF